jgi:hypothetical protein
MESWKGWYLMASEVAVILSLLSIAITLLTVALNIRNLRLMHQKLLEAEMRAVVYRQKERPVVRETPVPHPSAVDDLDDYYFPVDKE